MNLFSRKHDSCHQSGSELSSDKWGHLSLPLHFHPSAPPISNNHLCFTSKQHSNHAEHKQYPPLSSQAMGLLSLWSPHASNSVIWSVGPHTAQTSEIIIMEKDPLVFFHLFSIPSDIWGLHHSRLFPRPKSVTSSAWTATRCLV